MKEKLIEGILENFDFDRVRKVMELLDWKYLESDEIPTTYKLIRVARKKLEDAYDGALKEEVDYYCSSGGFKAFAEYNGQTVDFLQLEFILSDWSEQIDDE